MPANSRAQTARNARASSEECSAAGGAAHRAKIAAARRFTSAEAVAAELAKDGLDRATFGQVWIGETGSGDTGVADRRVDIVLER